MGMGLSPISFFLQRSPMVMERYIFVSSSWKLFMQFNAIYKKNMNVSTLNEEIKIIILTYVHFLPGMYLQGKNCL
jgi:hypothetical protein